MPIDLTGKPIIITGASSGIGAATALHAARAGMPVLAMARRAGKLEELAAQVRAAGSRCEILTGDVADPGASAKAVTLCIERFGSVYAVFANAGYGVEVPVHEMTEPDLRAMFEVNFFGSMHLVREAVPHMLSARAGHVLMCSSCLAKFSLPYFGVYSATKAAQNHIARAMKLELEPFGVHVSSVHPVGTRTEFFDTAQKLSGSTPMIKHSGEAFMQSPDVVAAAILRCLRRPKSEVWTSRFVRIGMAICTAFPALGDMGVRRMVKERMGKQAGARVAPHAPAR